jgi:hypothetical protein
MTEHQVEDTQEMEYGPALVKEVMVSGADHFPFWYVIDTPVSVTTMQNLEVGHETEINPPRPETWLGDHLEPLKPRISPSKFVAMQNRVVAHETPSNRSLRPPVDVVLYVVQE